MPSCLLVEDNEVNLAVAKRMLEKLGFSVIPAPSAEEALACMDRVRTDTILLDWHLPGMNGIDLLKKIRSTERGKNTAIFIYSGVEDETGIREALKSGADGFIPKPITVEKVTREFQKLRLL